MKRLSLPLVLLALLLSMTLTSCLEFKEQTLAFQLDTAHDTLRIFQDYHGIFGEKGDTLSADEQEQLQSVLTTERTFFFTNWVYEINKTQLKEALAQLHDPNKPHAEPKPDDYTKEELERAEHLGQLVVENVHIKNGTLYFDDKHRVCGTQQVIITHWSEVLAAGNAALRDMLRHEWGDHEDNAEEKAALLTRIDQISTFLRVQNDGIEISLPISREKYDSLTAEPVGDSDSTEPASESMLAAFKRLGGKISYADHGLTITFTAPAGSLPSVTLPTSTKAYSDNVVAPLKEKKHTIEEKHDVSREMRAFLMAK